MPHGSGYGHGPDQSIQRLMEMVGNPSYGLRGLQQSAGASSMTAADYLGIQRAQGGSSAIANEQFEAAQNRGQQNIFGAMQGAQMQRAGMLSDLVGLQSDRDQFGQQMDLQRDQFDFQKQQVAKQRRMSMINNLLGIGGTIAGVAAGGPLMSLLGGGGGNGGVSPQLSQFQMPRLNRPMTYGNSQLG